MRSIIRHRLADLPWGWIGRKRRRRVAPRPSRPRGEQAGTGADGWCGVSGAARDYSSLSSASCVCSIGGTHCSLSSSVRLRVLRHFGYPEHPRNGPRRPNRTTIGFEHFSHAISVVIALGRSRFSPSSGRVYLQAG